LNVLVHILLPLRMWEHDRNSSYLQYKDLVLAGVELSSPCARTVPQLCSFGSMSGASAAILSVAGSMDNRSSCSIEKSGRFPALTINSSISLIIVISPS